MCIERTSRYGGKQMAEQDRRFVLALSCGFRVAGEVILKPRYRFCVHKIYNFWGKMSRISPCRASVCDADGCNPSADDLAPPPIGVARWLG